MDLGLREFWHRESREFWHRKAGGAEKNRLVFGELEIPISEIPREGSCQNPERRIVAEVEPSRALTSGGRTRGHLSGGRMTQNGACGRGLL